MHRAFVRRFDEGVLCTLRWVVCSLCEMDWRQLRCQCNTRGPRRAPARVALELLVSAWPTVSAQNILDGSNICDAATSFSTGLSSLKVWWSVCRLTFDPTRTMTRSQSARRIGRIRDYDAGSVGGVQGAHFREYPCCRSSCLSSLLENLLLGVLLLRCLRLVKIRPLFLIPKKQKHAKTTNAAT